MTRGSHACDDGRIGRRHEIDAPRLAVEQRPPRRGREPHHVHGILDDDRHTRKRSQRFAGQAPPVDGSRILDGLFVDEDDRVVARVEGLDLLHAVCGEAFRGERAGSKTVLDLRHGQGAQVQRRRDFRGRGLDIRFEIAHS
jgi:hypothetical protein